MSHFLPLLILLLLASISDITTRTIPNTLIVLGMILAVFNILWGGTMSMLDMLKILVVVGWVGFLLFKIGWLGAGDIKLIMMIEMFLPLHDFLLAMLYTMVLGGVVSLGYKYVKSDHGVPYALAITLGVLCQRLLMDQGVFPG
ncbi:MAG: hypothetical protein B7Z60_00775 [Ferrovum sp. 37-45-19]|nr:MAG: hypothetical protein B7Z65_04065 [Ferrovum sp. 21-44-67]OYV95514.1 MAG: hypothetical protein B7Z60_00775 [Ferrovum sp. 37-45-19]OZB31557.1 MAG: hypothetical protein B7X47_09965 [Ferrovum sp. 34-44-207]HQT81312.1 prepilin peptidase [Ferrovaceae bacterium]HQU05765.1 prepilin peptidase [Ferrovaceae bacterium]